MSSTINIPAVLIANVMGLAILFVVAIGNVWRLKDSSNENKSLLIMFFACLVNCIVDPICFIADGKSGLINRILVIGCNTILYMGGIFVAVAWIFLVASRLKIKIHPIHSKVIYGFLIVSVLALIVNIFYPIFFTVNDKNEYSRISGYWAYNACYFGFMLDGLILYLRQRYSSGGLKFFPVWAFLIPAGIGVGLQAIFYGISTAMPFVTVSVVCVILCIQNEFILRDKLTGLYNRFYLNTVEKRLKRYPNLKYSALMLDINGFKKINDTYGHNMGDKALIQLGSILSESVGKRGEVVRYAGDEFIIVVNTQDEKSVESIISRIHELLDKFNREEKAPYSLSVAIGHCALDFEKETVDSYVDKIDELMYENKQEYYQTHNKYDRLNNKKNTEN